MSFGSVFYSFNQQAAWYLNRQLKACVGDVNQHFSDKRPVCCCDKCISLGVPFFLIHYPQADQISYAVLCVFSYVAAGSEQGRPGDKLTTPSSERYAPRSTASDLR